MRFKRISPLLSAYSVVFGFASAYAAEPINLRGLQFQETQKQFHIALPGVKAVSGAPVTTADELKLLQQHKDQHNITHFRMQQQYQGFDVIGGYAIVHSQKSVTGLLSAGNKSTMNGVVFRGLQSELGKPAADFVKNGDLALQEFAKLYQGHEVSQQSVKPVVYMDSEHNAHWAYKVSLMVQYTDKVPEKPTAILDASTFKPFAKWNDVKTALTPAKAKGFGGNKKMGEYSYGAGGYPYLEITRDESNQLCYMENATVKVIDMKHRISSMKTPMQFDCLDEASGAMSEVIYWSGYKADGYDKQNGAYSPTNDALYIGYVINHLYRDWYDVNALSNRNGSPMQLVMRVHYDRGYENAFWDGEQMTFGDGENFFYPLVSLGVGAHEISHGFTEQQSDLQYYGESGGMNESFSDMAAQAAEFYSVGKSSWLIGAEIVKPGSGYDALRFMDVPSRDGDSIDSANEYYEDLDVHYSSGVFNRLFYLIATTPGWDSRKAFDVMVKANMDYWTPYSSFIEGGCGVMNATKDLGYAVADVNKALYQVGIDSKTCSL